MKKFLTFFAMLCVLLGVSVSASAVDPEYTMYVDVSNKSGWDNVYIRTQWNNSSWGWPVQTKTERIAGTNVFKVVFEYGDYANLTAIVFSKTKSETYKPEDECYEDGTGASGFFESKYGDISANACYTLNANNQRASINKNYTPPTSVTYPDLYFVGYQNSWTASNDYKFYRDGSVYTLTIPAGIYENDSEPTDSNNGWKIWEGTKSGDNWTGVIFGAPDVTNNTPLNNVAFNLTKGSNSKNLRTVTGGKSATLTLNYSATGTSTITVTWATGPATPVISKEGNVVTITCADPFYYTTDGNDPKQESGTNRQYVTSGSVTFTLAAENVTVRAASTVGSEWSNEATETYSYGMPVPTITIENGVVKITVNPVVEGAKIMYSIDNNSCSDEYMASFNVTEGQTVYAQYVHTILGSSTVAQATYAGAKTVESIELYTRKGIKDGYVSSGTPEGPDAEGVYKAGSVAIPSGFSGQRDWYNSTLSVRVKYSDESSEWYTVTETEAVGTIQPNKWLTAYKRAPWPTDTNANCGFQVEGSGGKTVTVYAKFVGSGLQIMASMPENDLKIGSSAPQIAGYKVGAQDDWGLWTNFIKKSDSPLKYEHEFTATSDKAYFVLKVNGKFYQAANGSLALADNETYKFTEKDKSEQNSQCTLSGLTSGTNYVLTLTDTEKGLRLSVSEAGIPKPVLVRNPESNVVTINVPDGCTLHYTINGGAEQTSTSKVTLTIPTDGIAVSAYFTKEGESGQGETAQGTFSYYQAPPRWATKEWTLSDNDIMAPGTVKYFYMSRYQNDDRVSPEWELIKDGDTYTLDYFMCIPAAEFRLRRIAKATDGTISYRDFGLDAVEKITPTSIGATESTVGTADDPKTISKSYTLNGGSSGNKARGYAWDLGYSLVSVKITDTTDGNNATGNNTLSMTLSVDFSHPSTANVAPIKGMPYIALTGSKLQIPAIAGQNIKHAAELPDGYDNAFTNAWIQYDEESNMLVYGDNVTGMDYYSSGKSYHKPENGAVMNSTILPPRYPIWFKLIDEEGKETNVTSNKTILKYKGQETRKFTTPDGNKTTKDNVKFAVYALNDMELSGLFKIYSGYGGFTYGSVANGLSLYSNWGVGHQPDDAPYASSTIPSGVAMPLNGGGPRTNADGTAKRDPKNTTSEGYDFEDNYAGRYFGFDKRTYVSELNFYYALEPDTEPINSSNSLVAGGGVNENYNSHHADDATWSISNPTNDGRNFSWFRFLYNGLFGTILLDKEGFDSGRVTWAINEKNDATNDEILRYRVTFYPVEMGAPEGVMKPGGTEVEIMPWTMPDDVKYVPTADNLQTELEPGWYEAKLEYVVNTFDEDGTPMNNVEKVAHSTRILIFKMSAAAIEAKQRVTTADDGVRVYHPVIDVVPDASSSIKALDPSTDVRTVYADITINGISEKAVTRIVDMDGNEFPTTGSGASGVTIEYKRDQKQAILHYPAGFITDRNNLPDMRFAIRNAAINERTDISMTISSSEGLGATSSTYAMVYMPAGVLYGKLVPDQVTDNENVAFNALAVHKPDDIVAAEGDDYARIRYVDKNNNDEPCYIGTMGSTEVMAYVKYIANDGTEKMLFGGKPLNMRFNPDDKESVYTSKRLKIAGIPYETETATDAAGEEIKVRKDQTAKFSVQLTYKIAGYDTFVARDMPTTLTYEAKELTSPRTGLADLKTKDDVRGATNADGKTIATDVTAITESFVENYGGLFTNIEDAHVALAAVPKNEGLIGSNSLDKWYMDHGDKYDDGKVNPHAPVNRRAIGHKDLTGTTTFDTPAEVHPLLREGASKVTKADDFDNTSTVNNAWWNSAASVAPAFHEFDHIKGDFVRDPSTHKILGWTSESTISKPSQHRAYWAGVKYKNKDAYKSVWNNGVLEVHEGFSVDVRDPKHGYYSMSTHFSKPTYTDEDGTEKPLRTAFHLGEMPLNANDIVAFYGNQNDVKGVKAYLGEFQTLRGVAMPIHEQINNKISDVQYGNDGKATAVINGKTYTLDIPLTEPWNYDNVDAARTKLAFTRQSGVAGLTDESPAEKLFNTAISNDGQQHHMFFKVRHVNHESWFVPGGVPEGVLKTQPLWDAFKSVQGFPTAGSAKEKDNFVMNEIRMNFDDYCPLAYDVRYTYPFLTTEKVTAENYDNSRTNVAAYAAEETIDPTQDFNRITNMYATVTPEEVSDVAARDTGRVPFFGTMTASPEEIVPTAISDVNDDIRGAGFSIVYNRAAGTVTITADGDRELKDAAVYDATGASLVSGTSADRISDQIIVLDVRNISRGAYVISTNLGGAKFMK